MLGDELRLVFIDPGIDPMLTLVDKDGNFVTVSLGTMRGLNGTVAADHANTRATQCPLVGRSGPSVAAVCSALPTQDAASLTNMRSARQARLIVLLPLLRHFGSMERRRADFSVRVRVCAPLRHRRRPRLTYAHASHASHPPMRAVSWPTCSATWLASRQFGQRSTKSWVAFPGRRSRRFPPIPTTPIGASDANWRSSTRPSWATTTRWPSHRSSRLANRRLKVQQRQDQHQHPQQGKHQQRQVQDPQQRQQRQRQLQQFPTCASRSCCWHSATRARRQRCWAARCSNCKRPPYFCNSSNTFIYSSSFRNATNRSFSS